MNNIDKEYQMLLEYILGNGVEKQDRTGTGTLSVFGWQIRHKMSEGFPLLTTKKMAWKTMVTELLWFLKGDTNIKFLVDNGCHIWDGDAYKNYVKWVESPENQNNKNEIVKIPESKEKFIKTIKCDDEIVRKMGRRYCENFAKQWGDLGPVYGKQWRSWEVNEVKEILRTENVTWPYEPNPHTYQQRVGTFKFKQIDQIQNLINELKTNPDSRRLMVNAWNVGELDQMVLPPCHYSFQVYTRELSEKERLQILLPDVTEQADGLMAFGLELLIKKADEQNIPTRAISLMWNQRSVDTFLGLPFNIASYGLLLEIIAKEVNMVPDELIGNLGDVHLYSNHIEQAKEQIGRVYTSDERSEMLKEAMGYENYHNVIKELMPFGGGLSEYYETYKIPHHTREPYPLPKVCLDYRSGEYNVNLKDFNSDDFVLFDYKHHPQIKAPLSN